MASRNAEREKYLQSRLDELAKKYRVPGAVVSLLEGKRLVEVATGIANLNTGIPVTTDTVFALGSITKVYTASLVMSLVDEGKIDLDQPITKYIPELRFEDPAASPITVRHLLCHSGGNDEFWGEGGRGDDALERFVASAPTVPRLYEPGAMFSYSNTGYQFLGRLIENVSDDNWDAILGKRLLGPLGAEMTGSLPEQILIHRIAIGHMPVGKSKSPRAIPQWGWERSPAGSICATAADLMRFVRLHLNEGTSSDGGQLLSSEAVEAMQQTQVEVPNLFDEVARGLGWAIYQWGDARIIGHDGNVAGQVASLRIDPQRRRALVILANSTLGVDLIRDLQRDLFGELFDIEVPPRPRATRRRLSLDLKGYEGLYYRNDTHVEFREVGGTLFLQPTIFCPGVEVPLRPIDEQSFLFRSTIYDADFPMTFFDFRDGDPQFVHMSRAYRRIEPADLDPQRLAKFAGVYDGPFPLTLSFDEDRFWIEFPQLPGRMACVPLAADSLSTPLGRADFSNDDESDRLVLGKSLSFKRARS